jgi:hypothetical protein
MGRPLMSSNVIERFVSQLKTGNTGMMSMGDKQNENFAG